MSHRECLHEGAELAHELWEVPSLHQRRPELKGDAEEGQHHVRQRQGRDVVVGHSLHPPGKFYSVFDKFSVLFLDECFVFFNVNVRLGVNLIRYISDMVTWGQTGI